MTCSRLARAVARTAVAAVLGSAPIVAWQAKPAQEGTARIGGTVKSAADDRPLSRARVIALAENATEPHVAITGADGKYVISDLPAGAYTISVTRTGYAPQTYGQGRQLSGVPLTIASGQQVAGIDLALIPGRSITGRILDEDGTAFAGAVVEALVSRFQAGADTLVSVASAQTDDRGEFRLFGLPPGQYYVSASDPAFRSVMTAKGVLRYSPTYYPGVPFADQAKTIMLTGSEQPLRVEFALKLVPPARVSGQIAAEDGRQLLNGVIIMSPRGGEGVPMVAPDNPMLLPDGRFSFGHVVPGRYQIRARGQTDPSGNPLFAVFSIEILGADIEGISMTLRPGAQLEGRLAIDGRRGSKAPLLPTLRVRAPFTDGTSFGDALTGTVQSDGTFVLRGLMNGGHQIVVDGLQPPWVVKSILYRGSDITDRQIDISAKEQFKDVRITITDASSIVTGVVKNARNVPVANVGVLVFPNVPLFWMRTNRRMRVAYTDAEGRFTLPGLPSGEYVAVASMSVDESDLGRRDRLRALQAIGVPFRLETDDAQTSVTLQVAAQPPAGTAPGVR